MKKALSAVLAVVLVLSVCFSVPMIASAGTSNGLVYKFNNTSNPTGYIVTGYTGNDVNVVIPDMANLTGEMGTDNYLPDPVDPQLVDDGATTGLVITGKAVVGEKEITGATIIFKVDDVVVTSAEAGNTVTVEASATGYNVTDVTVEDANSQTVAVTNTEGVYTFTMPETAVNVVVEFVAIESAIEIEQPAIAGETEVLSAKVGDEAVSESVAFGTKVQLAAAIIEDYIFASWKVTKTGDESKVVEVAEDGTFTMPEYPVTVSAIYTKTNFTISIAENAGFAAYVNDVVVTKAAKGTPVVIKPTGDGAETKIVTKVEVAYNETEKLTGVNSFTMPEADVTVTAEVVQGYTVTIDDAIDATKGAVSVDKTLVSAGEKVRITVTPKEGYALDKLTINGVAADNVTNNVCEYTFPTEATANIKVSATFKAVALTAEVDTAVVNGEIGLSAKRGESEDSIELNALNVKDIVTITIDETKIAKGCELVENSIIVYKTDDKETTVEVSEDNTFVMPGYSVTVTATFAPKSMPVIGIAADAFAGNTKVEKITIGENVESIAAGAFAGCTSIKEFVVDENNAKYVSEAGVLFEKVTTTGENPTTTLTLIAFPTAFAGGVADIYDSEKTTYTIPKTLNVTKVAAGAFQAPAEGKDYAVDYVFGFAGLEIADGNAFKTPVHTTGLHVEEDGWDTAEKIEIAANCTYAGTNHVMCGVCNVKMETVPVAIVPTAHVPGDYTVDQPKTCTKKEIKTADCALCGTEDVSRIETEATGHTKATEKTIIKSTCKTLGREFFKCTTCGEELDVVNYEEYAAHVVPDENVISEQYYVAPTCEKEGSKTGLCTVCDKEDAKVIIPALDHDWVKDYIVEKTCTVDGEYYEYCSVCGEDKTGKLELDEATGHIAGDWEVTKVATCSETGLAVIKCTVCNQVIPDTETEKYTRVINALGHTDASYNWETTTAATCTTEGVATGKCKTCDKTTTKAIPKLTHTYSTEWTVDTAATCETKGSESRKCSVCGDKTEIRDIAVKPHTVDLTLTGENGTTTITKQPTHFETGLCDGVCTACKKNVTGVVVPTTPHVFTVKDADGKDVLAAAEPLREDIVIKAEKEGEEDIVKSAVTCTEDGYVAVYCTIQGCDEYKEDSVAAEGKLGHNFDATHVANKPDTQAPTCEDVGYEYKWCKRCSDAEATEADNYGYIAVEIAAAGHSFTRDAWVDGIENDCINAAYKAKHCSNAGCNEYDEATKVKIKEKGHLIDEDAWTTDAEEGGIAPTCTSVGKSVNKCKRDGCVAPDLEKEVAKLAHNFSYDGAQKVTKHPTCTEEGYDFIKCSGCNEIQKSNIKVALGHDTSNNTPVVRAATCENEGSSHTDCNRYFVNGVYDATVTAENAEAKGAEKCNGINETIDALGHVYKTEYEIITPVTCDEDGTEARKCVRYGKDGCTAIDAERRVPATGHKFTVEKVIPGKEATCQRTGEKALYCANGDCKEYDTSSVKTVAKVDHDYSADWITDKQPTCLKNGEGHRFKLCKNCGEAGKIEETLPKLDHNITTANTATEPATCLEPGYTYKVCQNVFTSKDAEGKTVYTACEERVKIDDIDATGHNLDKTEGSGYVKQDPTCTQGGFEEGFCKNCNPDKDATKGKVRINEVPATGHKFSAENTKIDPTCQKEGSITGVCQVNGCDGERDANGKVTQTLEKLEHAYGEWVAVKAESTKETHVLKRTCTTCVEAAATDSTPALTKAFETKTEDHTSGGWVVDKAATCGTAGSMTDYCAVCDYALDSAVIPATKKHNLKDVEVLSQPECEKVGSKTVECQNENCIEGADGKYTKYTATVEIEELGHSYTEWATSVAPTCTTKGYSSSICERCLDTQTKVLIPLGHDLGADIVDEEAKCGVAGKKHNECSRCDYTEEDIIPAKNHDFADNTLNTCKNGCGAKIYEYTLVGESTTDITITKYNGDIKDLRIPERLVDGDKVYNVVAIGDRAFMGTYVPAKAATETTEAVEETFTTKVNTVVIPDSVTSIGAYAFANSGLKIATIPATVTSIGDNAFGYKVEIQLVDAPAANTPATTAEDGEGTTTAPEKVEKLVATRNDAFTTIYGDAKSAAETYVTKHAVKDATNNIAFVALSSVYTFAPDVKENDVTIIAKNADDVYVITDYAKGTPEAPAGSKEEQIKALVKLPAENTANYKTVIESSIDVEGIYGTGTKVIVKDASNNVIDEVVIAIKGDLNGDGVCDVLDCMKLQLAVNSGLYLEDASKAAGDYATSAEGPAITIDDLNGIVNQACPRDRTPRYSVNVATVEGGTITANPATKILAEATVTLTVAPAEGKQLKAGSLSVKNGDTAIEVTAGATAGTYTFAMPAGDVTVTAEFEAIPAPAPTTYTVTVPEATADGGVTTDKTTAEAGATVTLTAAPATGKKVKALTVKAGETAVEVTAGTGENANKYTFTMPAANVTVTVEFEDATATPAPTTYTVTVGELTGGTIVATPASAAKDATVTLTVTAAEGKQLKAGTLLVKAGDATVTTTAGATADTYTFVMPEANVTVTAEFEDVAVTPAPTPEA